MVIEIYPYIKSEISLGSQSNSLYESSKETTPVERKLKYKANLATLLN